jgi:hypothetical protein
MPISYYIDETSQRIYTRAEGLVTFAELHAHMNAEESSPAASYSEIFDCSGATTNITSEQIRLLAAERQTIANRQPAAPVAVVATNNVFFGMLRMFDVLTEHVRPLRVFRNAQEAERWLDEITGWLNADAA